MLPAHNGLGLFHQEVRVYCLFNLTDSVRVPIFTFELAVPLFTLSVRGPLFVPLFAFAPTIGAIVYINIHPHYQYTPIT